MMACLEIHDRDTEKKYNRINFQTSIIKQKHQNLYNFLYEILLVSYVNELHFPQSLYK